MAKKQKNAVLPEDEPVKKGKKAKKSREKSEGGSKVARGIANPVRNLIVTTVASVLLGVAFILKPYEFTQYCGYVTGGLLAVVGIIYILIYFLRKPVSGVYRSEFVVGLVALLAGVYVALSGVLLKTGGVGYIMIIRAVGLLIIADGLLKVQYAVDIGRMKFRAWWVALIFAVLSVGIGVLTTTNFSGTTITSSQTPVSMIYDLGDPFGLGASYVSKLGPSYSSYATYYGGLMMLGIAFALNGLLDLATLIIIAVRNRKAARIEAIYAASAMMAEAKKDELALPPEAPSAEPEEEIVFTPEPAPEPAPAPEPEFIPAPAPAPVVEAPSAEPAVPEVPALEQPPMAAPMDE